MKSVIAACPGRRGYRRTGSPMPSGAAIITAGDTSLSIMGANGYFD